MVMPRSFSISILSRTCADISRSANPPVNWISRSASVDFPWSIWALIEKLRIWDKGVVMTRPLAAETRAVSIVEAARARARRNLSNLSASFSEKQGATGSERCRGRARTGEGLAQARVDGRGGGEEGGGTCRYRWW